VRGTGDLQYHLFSSLSADERVPADQPLRVIEGESDAALKDISVTFTLM
jgi:hypothetical protein